MAYSLPLMSMFLPLLWFSLLIFIMTHNWIFVQYFQYSAEQHGFKMELCLSNPLEVESAWNTPQGTS